MTVETYEWTDGTTRAVRRFHRASLWAQTHGHGRVATLVAAASRIVVGVEIEPGAVIGPGLQVRHGMAVVIGRGVVIGRNCRLHQQVTIGADSQGRYPVLGDDVVIYPGAKVFGGITLGDGAVVGANAVVNTDVPAGCTAVGVPARIIEARVG